MTRHVSDNPADSLRRELEAVIHRSGPMHFDRCASRCSGPTAMEQGQAGCVLPFVEAARADERERARRQAFTEAANAIEAERQPCDPEGDVFMLGRNAGTDRALKAVRGLSKES